ncbi:MAG: hypothetical protein IKE42_15975 [Aquamicrobium sp.]|nr:hypothetical protein [Aquamicrobium sp.]
MFHEKALRIAMEAASDPALAPPPPDFSGRWVNQIQSSMDLTIAGDEVTGSYTSASSSGGGPVSGPIRGYVAGDRISFVVLWPKGSMTAWVGQMVDDDTSPKIKTLWHLVSDIPEADEPQRLWLSTFAGADEFHR